MTVHDILDIIGDAKDSYVWDAQQVREGFAIRLNQKAPAKKMW